MMQFVPFGIHPLLAADGPAGAMTTLQLNWPESPWQWLLYGGGTVLAVAIVIAIYRRDTVEVGRFWRGWLLALRLAVIAGIVVIALNPQHRTQRISHRPSRVALLLDTSVSMRFPHGDSAGGSAAAAGPTRAEAVQKLLSDSELIPRLQERHEISVYTFDSQLRGPEDAFRNVAGTAAAGSRDAKSPGDNSNDEEARASGPSVARWQEFLEPRGYETRLGESLQELLRQIGGRTLSGVVVISDGGSNAGVEPSAARGAARAGNVRLVTVGVGSTAQPVNVQLARLQAPSDVHIGDPFEATIFVQGTGLLQQPVKVELLMRRDGETEEPQVLETREVFLEEEGVPVEVKFTQQPADAGTFEYLARATVGENVRELSTEDNQSRKLVQVVERPTRVLLFASGPMRDYRFVRNMLYRHSGVDVDVLLQSVDSGTAVSQDADDLLLAFPATREALFNYDVIIAFDPNWKDVGAESIALLQEWVADEAGGLIIVAGDVNTPTLARSPAEFPKVLELYPVVLASYVVELGSDRDSRQAWPVELTREGQDAGFLQLEDEATATSSIWEDFTGIYRAFPTNGAKAGATIFARYGDPRAQTEHGLPILIATQFYGAGRTCFIGSGEVWRLRADGEEYYDRFWTKMVREMGQARMKRGNERGALFLERSQYVLGQTVHLRARVRDQQYNDLDADFVSLEVIDPRGRPTVPARRLVRDRNQAGRFVGDFRAGMPGTYQLELVIPDSTDRIVERLDVVLPSLETDNPRQNAQLLRNLSQETGGAYVALEDAAETIPELLPNRGESLVVDDSLLELWDKRWVMFLLVGLLSVEWLTRKLLKLA